MKKEFCSSGSYRFNTPVNFVTIFGEIQKFTENFRLPSDFELNCLNSNLLFLFNNVTELSIHYVHNGERTGFSDGVSERRFYRIQCSS